MNKQERILDDARTADEAVKRINDECESCYMRCSSCPWSEDDNIRRLWKEHHPDTMLKAIKPRRRNKHKDGRVHNATNLWSVYSELREEYKGKKGRAKESIMKNAYSCGLPTEIKTVQMAIPYAEQTTLRYKRKTIAEYMLDKYNNGGWEK